ncbi:A-kinase anchor protein 6, partial [Dissostichus eleginoides]
MNSLEVRGHGAVQENPRSALSPLTNSLLEQLEARIKDLKAWLRDTELLIFNSCLGRETDAKEQLHSFKTPPVLLFALRPPSITHFYFQLHLPPAGLVDLNLSFLGPFMTPVA